MLARDFLIRCLLLLSLLKAWCRLSQTQKHGSYPPACPGQTGLHQLNLQATGRGVQHRCARQGAWRPLLVPVAPLDARLRPRCTPSHLWYFCLSLI
jgi:hypothetical protein